MVIVLDLEIHAAVDEAHRRAYRQRQDDADVDVPVVVGGEDADDHRAEHHVGCDAQVVVACDERHEQGQRRHQDHRLRAEDAREVVHRRERRRRRVDEREDEHDEAPDEDQGVAVDQVGRLEVLAEVLLQPRLRGLVPEGGDRVGLLAHEITLSSRDTLL